MNTRDIEMGKILFVSVFNVWMENPTEIDPRIPTETDPLFFFQLAPGIGKHLRIDYVNAEMLTDLRIFA